MRANNILRQAKAEIKDFALYELGLLFPVGTKVNLTFSGVKPAIDDFVDIDDGLDFELNKVFATSIRQDGENLILTDDNGKEHNWDELNAEDMAAVATAIECAYRSKLGLGFKGIV